MLEKGKPEVDAFISMEGQSAREVAEVPSRRKAKNCVGANVSDVPERKREELLRPVRPIRATLQRLGSLDQRVAQRGGPAVVTHVAPKERLLVKTLLHT